MSSLSFTNSRPVGLSIAQRQYEQPFDNQMRFNQIIWSQHDKPETATYSISPAEILSNLKSDHLEPLMQISLGCSRVKNGMALWDVIFNAALKEGLIGCIFIADQDYAPLRRQRVKTVSNFLDTGRMISRLQLNLVDKGSSFAVGIFDMRTRKTFVLLYTVEGFSLANTASMTPSARDNRTEVVNAKLAHIYVIDADNSAEVVDVDEDREVSDNGQSLVEWVITSVNDVDKAYPWKAHFLPVQTVRPIDLESQHAKLTTLMDEARDISYEAFESICRDIYEKIRNKRSADNRRHASKSERDKAPKQEYTLPEVEVLKTPDGVIYATILSSGKHYKFTLPQEGKAAVVEQYLSNKDLEGRILQETSGIFLFKNDSEGKPLVSRVLSINF